MLTLWLAYSHYRRRKSNLRIALGRPGPTFDHRDDSLLSPSPGHWSAINSKEVAAFVHRVFARKSHQVMYKKRSKDRHED
jgi:hypothetical protein